TNLTALSRRVFVFRSWAEDGAGPTSPICCNGQDAHWPDSLATASPSFGGQDGCATYLPEVRGFQLHLPARFSSSLRLRAGSSRRSFRPSSNRAMTAHLADANTRDHSSVSAR